MNDISHRLLFDGYKSLSNKIDEIEYDLKKLKLVVDQAINGEEEFEERTDLIQELTKRLEAVLSLCNHNQFNVAQFKAVLNRLYKSFEDENV